MFRARATPQGFTLLEMVIVVSLIVILLSLIVVKAPFLSQRQLAITEARKLGLLIENWRERAQAEETTFALRLDLNSGTYRVLRAANGNAPTIVLREGQLVNPLTFGAARMGNQPLPTPVTFLFTPDGLMPESQLDLREGQNPAITLHIQPLWNEVKYLEH